MSWSANMGFLFNSRHIDFAITLACLMIGALGISQDDDLLISFIVPAGIGIFRQFAPLLTVPYVFSIGISVFMLMIWLGIPAKIGLSHLSWL